MSVLQKEAIRELPQEPESPDLSIAISPSESTKVATSFFWSLLVTGLPLCLGDIFVVLAVSSFMGYLIVPPLFGIDYQTLSLLLLGLAVTTPTVFYIYGLYPCVGMNSAMELSKLTKASTLLALVYIAATTAQGLAPGSNTIVVALAYPCWLAGIPITRWFIRRQVARSSWWGLRTVVIGDAPDAENVYDLLRRSPTQGLRPTGYVDGLHSLSGIRQIAEEENVHHAVVAVSDIPLRDVLRLLANGDHGFLQLTVIPSAGESFDLGLETMDVGNHTLGLVGKQRLLLPLNRILKRSFDVVAVLVGGFLILPLLLGIAVLIKLTSRGPIFYRNSRIGRRGRMFHAWKFRTMHPNADKLLHDYLDAHPELRAEWERDTKLKDDPRITRIGRILRRTSLDELPQLWNVLRGDMSLVGPRPILEDEVAKYAEVYELYAKVVPGITGLWQVSGRNNTTYDDRLLLVTSYVRNWSLWLDICILAKTIGVVIRGHGAY